MEGNSQVPNGGSRALSSIVGEQSAAEFFDDVWQRDCRIYRRPDPDRQQRSNACVDEGWNEERVRQDPYNESICMGWEALVNLLHIARTRFQQSYGDNQDTMVPLIFRDQESLSPNEAAQLYGGNLFAAYLDGCSVILNHADWLCPYIAALCLDLQKSFPHAYANAYLTPPNAQAVNAHADDRDVLVIQVVGQKHWKVYRNVPIPYPYPHEQVGKSGLDIPPSVLDGPVAIETVLNAGDVLYMPRGHVHEARTSPSEPSFHVTIALATHDWTLGGIVSTATRHVLTPIIDYRQAMPLSLPLSTTLELVPNADMEIVQQQLDNIWERLRESITVESIHRNLQISLTRHNERAGAHRQACFDGARCSNETRRTPTTFLIGPTAAQHVQLSTIVRASTVQEKERVVRDSSRPQGLHVREATADTLLGILHYLKTHATAHCGVAHLRSLLTDTNSTVCDLTLLCFARCCVELGAMAIVPLTDAT